MAASTDMEFCSLVQFGNRFAQDLENSQIKAEPMFFNASVEYAIEKGGPITQSFLAAIPESFRRGVFDSRVHMLMPGWYPGIPGWHHDDIPRAPVPPGQHFMTAGQPDYDNPAYHARHCMGLVNAEVCPTAFAIGNCTMPAVPEGELIYRKWHAEVERLLEDRLLFRDEATDRRVVLFDDHTFHCAQKARASGWRWFGRVTIGSDRCRKENITNEIRSQVQVYLEFPMEGW